jgi:enolase-phosphatase E1
VPERASGGVGAILLDIEGTTTPVAFVTQVLFPYARTHLRAQIERHAGSDEYESPLAALRDEHLTSLQHGEAVPAWTDHPDGARTGSAVAYVEWLMDRDRKSTALKQLQGLVWQDGYMRGELVGEVFPDVPPALRRWRDQGLSVGIFSSGSVLAQQLFFQHSSAGDLTGLLQSFFDTNVGPKVDPQSYRRIATDLGLSSSTVVFLSDATRELDAARDAGLQVRLVIRPGNAPLAAPYPYEAIRSFDEL